MAGIPAGEVEEVAKAIGKGAKGSRSAKSLTRAETIAGETASGGRFDGFSREQMNKMKSDLEKKLDFKRTHMAKNNDYSDFQKTDLTQIEQNLADVNKHMGALGDEMVHEEEAMAKTEESFMDEMKRTAQASLKKRARQHIETKLDLGGTQAPPGEILVSGSGGGQSQLAEQTAQRAEQQAEQQKEIQEATSANAQDLADDVAALEDKRDKKIERVDSGPHGLMAIYSARWIMLVQAAVDGGIGLIPVVGDFISFFIFLFLWSIPCIIMFDIMAFVRILGFLIIDLVIGFIPGIGDALDFVPELLVMAIKGGPPNTILKAFNEKKEIKKRQIRERFTKRIADLKDKSKSALKRKLGQIRGHFSGLGMDSQKIIFLLIIMAIAITGPFGLGFISLDGGSTSYIIAGLLLLILIISDVFGMIDNQHLFGVAMFLVINMASVYMVEYISFIPFLSAGGGAVFTVLFFLYSLFYTLHVMGYMSTATIGKIIMVNIVLLLLPFLIGRFANPDLLNKDIDNAQVRAEIIMEDANIIDRLLIWVQDQYRDGSGDDIGNGDLENPHEYASIKIESVELLREQTLEGQPAIAYVYYSGKLPETTTLRTTCRVDEIRGEAEPEFFDISTSTAPRVKCTFTDLPAGSHNMAINSFFTYTSSVDIPLRFMDVTAEDTLLKQLMDSSDGQTVEDYTGGKALFNTNTGPVKIGVSNAYANEAHELRLPMIADKTNLDLFPLPLRFELEKSAEDFDGGVQEIVELKIDVPGGIDVHCDGINDGNILTKTPQSNGESIIVIKYADFVIEMNEVVNCYLHVNPSSVESFLPNQGWTEHTITLFATYNYAQKKAQLLEVI